MVCNAQAQLSLRDSHWYYNEQHAEGKSDKYLTVFPQQQNKYLCVDYSENKQKLSATTTVDTS